jgi:hypothetical protein
VRVKAALLLLLAAGCARGPVEDRALVEIGGLHAAADQALDRGDRDGARRALEAAIAATPADHPLRRPLVQDGRFRLARLALVAGDPAAAAREADSGLALGDGGDLYTANLLVVRGTAREALGQGGAAAADYERALAINEVLLRGILPAP